MIAAPGPRRRTFALRLALTLFLGLLAAAAGGCPATTGQDFTVAVHDDYGQFMPRTIAVLPFDNMSADLDATPLVRPIVADRVRFKGYQVPDLNRTDELLQETGVMVSHDVYAFTAAELGEALGVDAVMYGTITDFTTKYAFLYASVAVQVRMELVDCKSGEVLWHNEQRSARNTGFESAFTLLIYILNGDLERGLAVVSAANAIWAALETYAPYAQEAAAKVLEPLPPGPKGERPYPYDPGDRDAAKIIIYHSVIVTAKP
jgi:hypothetical protein